MDVLNDLIYPVIDELKENMDEPDTLVKSPDTPLIGPQSVLDSLDFVDLTLGIESKLTEELGITIVLANEKAMAKETNPFSTIQTLTDYVKEIIAENK